MRGKKYVLKNNIRDTMIIIVGYLQNLLRQNVQSRVVSIHDVKDPIQFQQKIQWLKQNYEICSLSEILESKDVRKARIALTFDDGFNSWSDICVPILRMARIPAVFFVNSGLIDLEGVEWEEYKINNLNRQQTLSPIRRKALVEIANDPLFDVGGHTKNHVDLSKISNKALLRKEIFEDKQSLEEICSMDLRWFAYPFGAIQNVTSSAIEAVHEAGYLAAFTIIPGSLGTHVDTYLLPRNSLDIDRSRAVWRAWLYGGYDRMYRVVHSAHFRHSPLEITR